MQDVTVIEFPGMDSIKSNLDYYKQKFLDEKIIVFRNAYADFAMQQDLMHIFGDLLGWYPNSKDKSKSDYIEDHHKHMKGPTTATKDEWMLGWHIEWVEYENDSFYGSTWNMTKFDCDYDTGNTCFYDMTDLYNRLDKDETDFLDKCRVEGVKKDGNNVRFDYVKSHWITNEKTLRPHLGGYLPILLVEFDGREPLEEDNKRFIELNAKVIKTVWEDTEFRKVHRWQKGDLLIPDLFKLAHAVTGGFGENQRRLDGMFGKQKTWGEQRQW